MTKLHSVLAVESDLKNSAKKIYGETKTTFTKKDSHFEGLDKIYTSFEEEGDKLPAEYKELIETVSSKLKYFSKSQINAIDASLTKEEGNASGKANSDLVVDGENLGKFSATSLLALENWVKSLREMYLAIPTLDPSKKWNQNEDGTFTTETEVKYRSVDKKQAMTLSEATDKHKAQVEIVSVPVQVGKYETTYKSGKITPLQKSNYLTKIDSLIIAIKEARTKANEIEITAVKAGEKILNWING